MAWAGAGAAGLVLTPSWGQQALTSRKPNIVLIVADDLGYADLGCQGSEDVRTPHIDSIAKAGVRFTDGYVSSPMCSPSRAGMLTGRYQQRFGHELNPLPANRVEKDFGLPLSERTLADQLKLAGYATGIVGKWHLGMEPKYHPMKRGFDEFFGFLHGSHSYISLTSRADRKNPILRGNEVVEEKEYLTDALSREAVSFVDRHKSEPFFLYLSYNAVHVPMEPQPARYADRFAHIADANRRILAAKLAAVDDGVGLLLEKLKKESLEEHTLVVFISDNGGETLGNGSRNTPLRGYKGELWEGGIRVPFLVRWTGKIAPAIRHDVVSALDLFPTALAIAQTAGPKGIALDGVDLIPLLTGKSNRPLHDLLLWRYGPDLAIRKENWKLLKLGEEPARLFDLADDVGEKSDLAGVRPKVVRELTGPLMKWNAQLKPPLWGAPLKRASEKAVGAVWIE
jgi:arylsulfatase A-like enzyme